MISLAVIAAALIYGLLVGKYEIFPYKNIKNIYKEICVRNIIPDLRKTLDPPAFNGMIETNLLRFKKLLHNSANPGNLAGFGGGICEVFGRVIGVDSQGQFFEYKKGGDISTLDISLPNNYASFESYLSQVRDAENDWRGEHIRKYFRVLGIRAKDFDGSAHIFVTYSFWHEEQKSKSIRVARLVLKDFQDYSAAVESVSSDRWDVLYDSSPLIPFSLKIGASWEVPFNTNHSGGGMALDGENHLIVGIGDHNYDGIYNVPAPQDDVSSYGKIVRINLTTLESSQLVKGVRNPQGIFFDRYKNLWFTDQGPKGGDELNLVETNANYGWPLVTYGTQYFEHQWPLNKKQGRHEGFVGPIFAWVPSIAISGGIEIKDSPIQWDGDLLVTSLVAAQLLRLRLVDGKVKLVEPIDLGYRVRDLLQMSDGTFLIWTDKSAFIELTPSDNEIKKDLFAGLVSDQDKQLKLRELMSACRQCHSFIGNFDKNKLSLWHVVGREIASTGYRGYSDALKAHRGSWTKDNLRAFLRDSSQFAPGTSMPSSRINDEEMLDLVVAFLERLQ